MNSHYVGLMVADPITETENGFMEPKYLVVLEVMKDTRCSSSDSMTGCLGKGPFNDPFFGGIKLDANVW